jgi:hypothetical protein
VHFTLGTLSSKKIALRLVGQHKQRAKAIDKTADQIMDQITD